MIVGFELEAHVQPVTESHCDGSSGIHRIRFFWMLSFG